MKKSKLEDLSKLDILIKMLAIGAGAGAGAYVGTTALTYGANKLMKPFIKNAKELPIGMKALTIAPYLTTGVTPGFLGNNGGKLGDFLSDKIIKKDTSSPINQVNKRDYYKAALIFLATLGGTGVAHYTYDKVFPDNNHIADFINRKYARIKTLIK